MNVYVLVSVFFSTVNMVEKPSQVPTITKADTFDTYEECQKELDNLYKEFMERTDEITGKKIFMPTMRIDWDNQRALVTQHIKLDVYTIRKCIKTNSPPDLPEVLFHTK